jgi:dTDP-4-dehydrorhamnose reductase
MSQTILVTGGTGQVGFELQRSLLLHGNILAPARNSLDLYDARAVASWLDTHRPQLIVNAAAYTHPFTHKSAHQFLCLLYGTDHIMTTLQAQPQRLQPRFAITLAS